MTILSPKSLILRDKLPLARDYASFTSNDSIGNFLSNMSVILLISIYLRVANHDFQFIGQQ